LEREIEINKIKVVYRNNNLLLILLTAAIVFLLPYAQVFASEIGGYMSEKLIERSGVASSSLTIGTVAELTQDSRIDVMMAPAISTLPAQITLGIDSATLRGNVDSLNNFPSATVWFEWGYDTNYGNTIGAQVVTSTGTYTAVITDLSDKPVHYRFCVSADGTNYGSDSVFQLTKTSTQTLIWFIPAIFAIFGTVALFALRGKPVAIIIAGIMIVIGVLILANVAGVLW